MILVLDYVSVRLFLVIHAASCFLFDLVHDVIPISLSVITSSDSGRPAINLLGTTNGFHCLINSVPPLDTTVHAYILSSIRPSCPPPLY